MEILALWENMDGKQEWKCFSTERKPEMARLARVVAAGFPHHVTQRGNARRFILDCDADRKVYLDLLAIDIQQCEVTLLGFCLMSNHVHLILVPARADALAKALKRTQARYASFWNAAHGSSGHAWQGRYYSCPLGESHLWQALRYIELNLVRAGLVSNPRLWGWSSAAAHSEEAGTNGLVSLDLWRSHWSGVEWRRYLAAGEQESELAAIRRCTYTGRPLGTPDFVSQLEHRTHRLLAPRKGGRPKKSPQKIEQDIFTFAS